MIYICLTKKEVYKMPAYITNMRIESKFVVDSTFAFVDIQIFGSQLNYKAALLNTTFDLHMLYLCIYGDSYHSTSTRLRTIVLATVMSAKKIGKTPMPLPMCYAFCCVMLWCTIWSGLTENNLFILYPTDRNFRYGCSHCITYIFTK